MSKDEALALSAAQGLGTMFIMLVCVTLAWFALQQFRFDLFVKQPKSAMARLLQLFAAIALGYLVARFLLDYFSLSQQLPYLF